MQKTRLIRVIDGVFKEEKASMGIGTMIIVVAMILVAGIAASVLIQTANQLETQGLQTGQETRDDVSAGIGVIQVIGQYGARNVSGTIYNRFHNMSMIVTSRAGGSGVDLSEVTVMLANDSKICILTWNSTFALTPSGSGVFSTANAFDFGPDEFGIIVIEDADGSCTSDAPTINRGDKAIITVNLSACFNGVPSKNDLRGMVIGEVGSPGVFLFRTPATSSKTVVEFM